MTGVTARRRVEDGYRSRERAVRAFFGVQAPALARTCAALAARFSAGGRILAFGAGPAATDAAHVAVEFVHPVIVGKRALPAISLPDDGPTALARAIGDPQDLFRREVDALGRPQDIAVGMSHTADDPARPGVARALEHARGRGMFTLALWGPGDAPAVDALFPCDEPDPFVVQEVQESLYHMLWELVHVFLEHEPPGGGRGDPTGFLYPFLSTAPPDEASLVAEVEASVLAKVEDVVAIREQTAARPDALLAAAAAVRRAVDAGATVLTFGNGGSATDAEDLVTDLLLGIGGRRVPALCLASRDAVVSALGNDVGFDEVFARQLAAYASPGDVAIGVSTSGSSRNVAAALVEARRRGLVTVAFAGYAGGRAVAERLADHVVIVDHEHVPRIQEAQASQYHLLCELVQAVDVPFVEAPTIG